VSVHPTKREEALQERIRAVVIVSYRGGSPSPKRALENFVSDLPGEVVPIPQRTRFTNKRTRKNPQQRALTQFRFQPFKKCYYAKCTTVFVPGDFKPSSPRRMFCSMKCFDDHWREKLSRYLETRKM
jgi:hypothetical protein